MKEDDVRTIVDKQLKEEKNRLIKILTELFQHSDKIDVGELVRVLAIWRDG